MRGLSHRTASQDAKYEEEYLSTVGVDFVRAACPPIPTAAAAAPSAASLAHRRSPLTLLAPLTQKNRTLEIDGKNIKFQLVSGAVPSVTPLCTRQQHICSICSALLFNPVTRW